MPLIEKFPVYYYEAGIKSLEVALQLHRAAAVEHWKGNHAFTLANVIYQLVEKSKDNFIE